MLLQSLLQPFAFIFIFDANERIFCNHFEVIFDLMQDLQPSEYILENDADSSGYAPHFSSFSHQSKVPASVFAKKFRIIFLKNFHRLQTLAWFASNINSASNGCKFRLNLHHFKKSIKMVASINVQTGNEAPSQPTPHKKTCRSDRSLMILICNLRFLLLFFRRPGSAGFPIRLGTGCGPSVRF